MRTRNPQRPTTCLWRVRDISLRAAGGARVAKPSLRARQEPVAPILTTMDAVMQVMEGGRSTPFALDGRSHRLQVLTETHGANRTSRPGGPTQKWSHHRRPTADSLRRPAALA